MDRWIVTALAVLVALALAALLAWIWRREQARTDRLHAMAGRRGWQYKKRSTSGGNPAMELITPADAGNWRLTVSHARRTGNASVSSSSEFLDQAAAWPNGTVLIGPSIPAGMAAMAESLLGAAGSGMIGMALEKIAGPFVRDMSELKHVAEPGGRGRPFTVFANVEDVPANVFDRFETLIEPWTARHTGEGFFPITIAGPCGIRIQVRAALGEAAEMEAFADLALTLRNLLSGVESREPR